MPFKSKAQMRKMFSMDEDMADEYMSKTPNPAKLPEKVAKKKATKKVKKSRKALKKPKK